MRNGTRLWPFYVALFKQKKSKIVFAKQLSLVRAWLANAAQPTIENSRSKHTVLARGLRT